MQKGETMFKLVSDWIEIEYMEVEDEEDLVPAFMYNDRQYLLRNFLRCHNNAWGGISYAPEYIHGYDCTNYWTPIFIEISDSGDCVRVYVEVKDEEC